MWHSPCQVCLVLSHATHQFDPKCIEGRVSQHWDCSGAAESQTPNFSAPAPLRRLLPATPGWFLTSFMPVQICNNFMLATGFITNCPCVKRPKSGLWSWFLFPSFPGKEPCCSWSQWDSFHLLTQGELLTAHADGCKGQTHFLHDRCRI